jgi:hypothetical protein
MAELHSATILTSGEVVDTLEIPARQTATAGLRLLTLGLIKAALGTSSLLDFDTDGTLAANSDVKLATQKAVRSYVATQVTGLLDFKTPTDCSGNPNYPAGSKGDAYIVSVAGKIGGASGTTVDIGDWYIATADNAGGTEAAVGASWGHMEHNLVSAVSGAIATRTEVLTGTDTTKLVTPDALASLWEQGADVASAAVVSLGEGGFFNVTGTTTITDIDFAVDKAGRQAWVKFAGVLTLTHNASTLILPTGASIITEAGDTALFVSEGSDVVRCISYQRASGAALAGGSSYTAENARDDVGAALVAGTGVSITVNDAADTITIASTSGAGAVLYGAPWTIPDVSTFTATNIGAVTGTNRSHGITVYNPATDSFAFRGWLKAAGASVFDLYARTKINHLGNGANSRMGVGIGNSTNSRRTMFGPMSDGSSNMTYTRTRWDGTSFNSSANLDVGISTTEIDWVRIEVTATNINFYVGTGYDWLLLQTETIASFMTASGGGSVDQGGFLSQGASPIMYELNSFSFVAPVAGGGGQA